VGGGGVSSTKEVRNGAGSPRAIEKKRMCTAAQTRRIKDNVEGGNDELAEMHNGNGKRDGGREASTCRKARKKALIAGGK